MATKNVYWFSNQCLPCSCQGTANVILCLDDSNGFITAQLIATGKGSACEGSGSYKYTIQYDTLDLPDGLTILATSDIDGVICDGCLTDWVKAQDVPYKEYAFTTIPEANITAADDDTGFYSESNGLVHVWGTCSAQPAVDATLTQLGIPLPIPSALANERDLVGHASSANVASRGAAVFANVADSRARMQWVSNDMGNSTMFFSFTYKKL